MKALAKSLIAGFFVIASPARADAIPCTPNVNYDCPLFPPERALPDVLYYIGAESNNFNTNEFGHSYYPVPSPINAGDPKASITYWQGITAAHSRWSSTSGSNKSYWFRVEHGMHTPGTSDEKSEVALPFSVGPGQDFYFGISILLPVGYVSESKWNLFFQLHSSMVLGSLVGLDTFPGVWPIGRTDGVKQSALGVHYQSGDATTGLTCAVVNGADTCPPVHNAGGEENYYFRKFADNSPGTWNDIILHVKLSSSRSNTTLNADGMLEVWHRKAGGAWTNPVSEASIVLGVTYSPKGMVADTYPRAGLYRDTWCIGAPAPNCPQDQPGIQPSEEIYLDNIVFARTLNGAKSVFPATDMGF